MDNENPVKDKTYTNSENSFYNDESVDLQILLPEKSVGNPYLFTAFDISQFVNGQQQNALFIYMKKETDDATDLSGFDDDTNECNFAFAYGDMTQLDSVTGFTSFDPTADNTLVIVYHDDSDDKDYQLNCAEAIFANVATFAASVVTNGNYQTSLNLMGGQPKKSGMSMVPRH